MPILAIWGRPSRQSFLALKTRPIMHQPNKFQQNRTIHVWVNDDSTNFHGSFFRGGGDFVAPSFRSECLDQTTPSNFPISGDPNKCFRCLTCCSISKRGPHKGDWGQKWRPKFGLFHSGKNYGRNGRNVLSAIFNQSLKSQTLISYGRGRLDELGDLVWLKRAKQLFIRPSLTMSWAA